jgi:hypothetical protein
MRRRLLPLLPLVALAAVACGSDTDPAAPGVAARAGAPGDGGDWVECENTEDGYALSRPAGWHEAGAPARACSVFDPEPDLAVSGSGDGSRTAVVIEHRDVPFDRAAAEPPEREEVVSVREEIVDGRDGVRRETEVGEGGSLPAGTRVTRWTVDLRGGRTLVARTTDLGDADYGNRQEVLDRMVTSIRWVEPRGTGEGGDPVGEPTDQPVDSDGPAAPDDEPALLSDVRVESHEGFDRLVVELAGDVVPDYRVAPVEPPFRRDDSDSTAPVSGTAFLEISLTPASLLDASGTRTYQGPDRIPLPRGQVVTEVVRTGGTQGPLAFVVGLGGAARFAVDVLEGPTRLVVDIVAGD